MAKRRTTKRRTSAPAGRRRFWNYPRPNKRGLHRWLPSWRFVVGSFLLVIGVVVGVGASAYYLTDVPSKLPDVGQENSTVYWDDGTVMTQFYNQDRTIIDYDTLPQCNGEKQAKSATPGEGESCMGDAVVASEDRTFWTNSGVDLKGTARAFINNVKGGQRQGGSTITQQYVERYYEGPTTSYAGKAKEAILALKIAQQQPKEEILGNYLNTIYFGRGANGIQAAAQAYFGTDADKLNYNQAAFLAGIIPSPNRYDNDNGEEWAKQRWQRTINFMAEDHYITPEQKAAAVFPAPGTDGGIQPKQTDDRYAGTTGYLIQMVRQELLDQGFTDNQIDGGGLQIYTTFDPKMQQDAVNTINSLQDQKPAPSPNLHGTVVSIDPATGGVRALYGGSDYLTSQFNDAVQGAAQPGSTFKPFALMAALEQGHSLNEKFDGNSNIYFKSWNKKVTNFGGQNFGEISLTKGTAFSVNTVYAALNDEIGPKNTMLAAYHAGIKDGHPGMTDEQAVQLGNDMNSNFLHTNPGNVLGTDVVHPVELANAYATIAAGGTYTPWHVVDKVTKKDGKTVMFQASTAYPAQAGAIDPDAAAGATYAMQQVVQMKGASGNYAQKLDRPVAGKTGTTSNNVSAWFAGFTPQLATVVGLFQTPDDGSAGSVPITTFGKWSEITGSSWPVQAWTSYMEQALAGQPVQDFAKYNPKEPLVTDTPTETPTPTEEPPAEATPDATPDSQNVTVPSLAGQSRDSALATLRGLGLAVIETQQYDPSIPAGTVIRTQPAGGSVPAGSSITVIVSAGPDPNPSPGPSNSPSPGGG